MSRSRVIACALALALAPASLSGCAARGADRAAGPVGPAPSAAATDEAGRYFMDATAVPPPAAPRDAQTAHALALVRRYIDDARLGRRDALAASYLPETRRSAETVVVRDLELAREGGPLHRDVSGYLSVALEEGRLWPPQSGELVNAEDADRLRALADIHDDAFIVLIRFRGGSPRPVFVVRDASAWWLLP